MAVDVLTDIVINRPTSEGHTRMTLRNCGAPSGFSKIAAPLMAAAMRRANHKDLGCLKALLERPTK